MLNDLLDATFLILYEKNQKIIPDILSEYLLAKGLDLGKFNLIALLEEIHKIGFADKNKNISASHSHHTYMFFYNINVKGIQFVNSLPNDFLSKPYSYFIKPQLSENTSFSKDLKLNKKSGITDLTSLQRVIINEPNQRFILWVIARDSHAFAIHFYAELTKQPDLMIPGKVPNLAKALTIFQNLMTKKMVYIKLAETKITWRGQFYRFYTHPAFPLFAIIFSAIVAFSVSGIKCKNEPKMVKTLSTPPTKSINSDSSKMKPKPYILNKQNKDS